MIRTEDLSKNFDQFIAVDGVDLEVGKGEVLALLGPNGAGKTTTVRMLTSILKPTRGRAWVAGYDVIEEPAKVRASVGVLTEHHGLYQRMPAHEYLDFFGQIYRLDKAKRHERIEYLLTQFALIDAIDRRIGEFSKGMRQKLALARAMLHDPEVLLLDEPTSAMDPESSRMVRDAIKQLRGANRSVIICTHNLAEAEDLADRIAIIRHGRIINKGTPAELRDQLLGRPSYRITFKQDVNGKAPEFPDQIRSEQVSANQYTFHSEDPQDLNPRVLKALMDQGFEVVSLQEVPRSLERVYLQAMAVEREEAESA
jgi:ABC-2 type transport system ATP-binding protein